MSSDTDWLTDRIQRIADNAILLDRKLADRPGDYQVRTERRNARQTLRAELARRVYDEHPDWPYRRQYYLYTAREREALQGAQARLAEKAEASA